MYMDFAYAGTDFFKKSTQAWAGLLSAAFDAAAKFTPSEEWRRIPQAASIMWGRAAKEYTKPPFDITSATVNGRKVAISEEVIAGKSFGDLIHFKPESDNGNPKVLLVAPMSGHYSSLVRTTAQGLLDEGLDVHVTDWSNARDVPLSEGTFGLDEYIEHVQSFMTKIGPNTHVVAVCQSTVPVLAAAARMEEDDSPFKPASLTLIAGPVDTRISPTEVNKFAKKFPIEWFQQNLITTVPSGYAGAGRRVYQGNTQLGAFISMNPGRHFMAHINMFCDLAVGKTAEAQKAMGFYDHYFAVADLDEDFYLGTVRKGFQEHQLAKGELHVRGHKVDPSFIKSPLLTIEGERDDICGIGQTQFAHELCKNVEERRRAHHLIPGVGHYGAFGRKATPVIGAFIQAMEAEGGVDNRLKSRGESPDSGQVPHKSAHSGEGINHSPALV